MTCAIIVLRVSHTLGSYQLVKQRRPPQSTQLPRGKRAPEWQHLTSDIYIYVVCRIE